MSSPGTILFARTGRCAGHRHINAIRLAALFAISTAGAGLTTHQLRAAEELSASKSSDPLTYRRVFVPADDTGSWPLDGQKFIPI